MRIEASKGLNSPPIDCRRLSTQIALFAGPVLVLLSYVIGPQPMDLLFIDFELVAIAVAVLSIAFIAHDGETHWPDGVRLLAVYVILTLGFFFLP